MASKFSYNVLLKVVSQICDFVGYSKANISALNVLADILEEFICGLGKLSRLHGEHCGRLDINIGDLSVALNSYGIQPNELLIYLKEVDTLPTPINVPRFPVSKTTKEILNMNFGNEEICCNNSNGSRKSLKIKISLRKIKELTGGVKIKDKHAKRKKRKS